MVEIIGTQKPGIRNFLAWVAEAQAAHSDWRRQSWEDWQFRDGQHWTPAAFQDMVNKGINPLTINRIFPILNLIQGHFIRNQRDVIAKGRTKMDNELAQVMSEGFAFVRDQNKGRELITSAFCDEITAGFGYIGVSKNHDPRQEAVRWHHRPWYTLWWDPYATPWLDKETCRYAFTAEWGNLEDVCQVFWDKRREIHDKFSQLNSEYYVPDVFDAGTEVEDYRKHLSSNHWVNAERKRIRPIEMWYTQITPSMFAIMPDSRVIDLDTIKTPNEQFAVAKASIELVHATVKKMRVATFLSDLLLQDVPTPYAHDTYPYAPFVGYLDRFNCPFGVPRQVKEQSMEVNKRRSMALALISNRRIYVEDGAVADVTKTYAEANRHNGLIILNKGKFEKFKIEEMSNLAPPQIDLMHQSEREIQEIVGANDEALSRDSALQSGVALDKKQDIATTVTASLLENANYSLARLGELTAAMIQTEWTGPKVLRVTDRVSGAEKFVSVNERVYDANTGAIVIRNNITESNFDIITAPVPMTDTMREKNMELIFSAINKAPPEAVGPLLNLAFEISDLPSKDALLKQVRAATGLEVVDDTLPLAEREAAHAAKTVAKQQADAEESDLQRREREAEIEKVIAEAVAKRASAAKDTRDTERLDWQAGQQLGQEILKAQTERVVQ